MCESSRFAVVPSARYTRRNVVSRIVASLAILLALGATSTAFALDGVWINPSGGFFSQREEAGGKLASGRKAAIAHILNTNFLIEDSKSLSCCPPSGKLQLRDTCP